MTSATELKKILNVWRAALSDSVRGEGPDLSARQMAILLNVYLTPPPHTVRGLAALLGVSKPAVTRALDTMSKLDLIRRKRDPDDRRNVLVQRTVRGAEYLGGFAELVKRASVADRLGEL